MADKNVILTMKIAGEDFEDLYPYELLLEEGFSRIYKARLTLLSDVCYREEDLAEILDTGISLSISQILRDALTQRTRYFHGIITATATEGIFSSGDQNCYRYVLTIESPLARLRFNMRNAVYYRKNPVDAVEAVLEKNRIRSQFPDSYISRNKYSKQLMFNQNGISDLDFIGNILFTYGISFTTIHPAVEENTMGEEELIFSSGDSFPAPAFKYSDTREVSDKETFDFIRAVEGQNIWKMDDFRMERSIGVDGIEVGAVYPEFNYGNEEWKTGDPGEGKRSITYNRLFTGYQRGTTKEEIDEDIKRILDARFRGFELAKQRWTGKAANLLLMPGLLFELAHFYALDDIVPITAMVTAARTHVRAVWPEHLVVRTQAAEGETVETAFSCINYAAGVESRFCGTLSQ
jgi:uncharacterized protein involved in type VI secretion and phage assembly